MLRSFFLAILLPARSFAASSHAPARVELKSSQQITLGGATTSTSSMTITHASGLRSTIGTFTGNVSAANMSASSFNGSLNGTASGNVYRTGDTMTGGLTVPAFTNTGLENIKITNTTGTYTAASELVIVAKGGFSSCSGSPSNACSTYGDQSNCENYNSHGGCTWNVGACLGTPSDSCGSHGDQGTCEANNSHGGCSVVNSCQGTIAFACGDYDADEPNCLASAEAGCTTNYACTGTPAASACSTWDGDQSGCESNGNHGGQCSWSNPNCTGTIACAPLNFAQCPSETGCANTISSCSGTAACSNVSNVNCGNFGGCAETFSSCTGTPSCSGLAVCNDEPGCSLTDYCSGTSSCQNNETYCTSESGCTGVYSGNQTINMPDCDSRQGRQYIVKKNYAGYAVTLSAYTATSCPGTPTTSDCSTYVDEGTCTANNSHGGCSWSGASCSGTAYCQNNVSYCAAETGCSWVVDQQLIDGTSNYSITTTSAAVQACCDLGDWKIIGGFKQ